MVTPTQSIIRPISRFQRAIHVRYDLRNSDAIEQYIPTQSAADALHSILQNTEPGREQRAHVLYAAYGSGKSHFAVALAGILENPSEQAVALHTLTEHLADVNSKSSQVAQQYVGADKHLFPVMLSGNEGEFAEAMLNALARSLRESHIALHLSTRFGAAINTIKRWQMSYPDFYSRLEKELKHYYSQPIASMLDALQSQDNTAYKVFVDLYAQMTAGAVFDPLIEQAPEIVYRDVANQLRAYDYEGIAVIWDEFGRYLEAHTSQAFGNEAAAVQTFAETCNYSRENQIHFLLFTHKELQGYATSLPQSYQQEWSRVEGRFQRHDLSTDPSVAYRLIDSAIQHTDPAIVHHYLDPELVESWTELAQDYKLFGTMAEQNIRQLIYNTWPLHPLAVFALAHLSNRVAQNERTMFTFLTSDESNALRGLIDEKLFSEDNFPIIRVADLWDYFETAIRADVSGLGVHRFWSGVINALDKVAEADDMAKEVVKALGVLSICAESSSIRPTTDLLSWAVGAETDEQQQSVIYALDNLRRRKTVMNRQLDGYWTFISGSDINFEDLLRTTLERVNPSAIQLRRLLEQNIPASYILARRYNQQHSMIRFFTGVYRWVDEIVDAPWDLLMDQEETDGLVVYVLATNNLELHDAHDSIQSNDRVIYVLPREDHPLHALIDILRELFAWQEIRNDASLRQDDDQERIQREIAWLLEDTNGRLETGIKALTDPRQNKSVWVTTTDQMAFGHYVNSPGQASKIVSDICDRIFCATPLLNSEGLNRRHPTAQQNRAAQQVIDALFSHEADSTLGMEGRGPEILTLNALLKLPGILRQEPSGKWSIARPDHNEQLAIVWDRIENHLDNSIGHKQSMEALITELTSPPYGLREGVLPVLIAAVLSNRLMVTSMWHHRSPISLIDGHTLTLSVEKPDEYLIEIGHWTPALENLRHVLMSRFDEYTQDIERYKQPLSRLRSGLTRWLQGLPAFCRFTRQLSPEAIKFRDVIRKVQTEPAKAIFESLPIILTIDQDSSAEQIAAVVDRLMQEISNAYYELQRRLDVFVGNEFGYTGMTQSGLITLKSWLSAIPTQDGSTIDDFKFSSTLTQNVINLLLMVDANDSQFWNQMSEAVLGVPLRDWNDNSEERFQTELLKTRDEVERDVHELIEEDKAVSFSIQLPDQKSREFRFRSSTLTQHGQRLLQNFKSTMEIAGRPLSVDERRKIALAFLAHVMGEDLDN